jgi:hypothetical protein
MKRLVLLLAVAVALTGCPNPPPGGDDAGAIVPEKAAGSAVNVPTGTAGTTAITPSTAAPTALATGTPAIVPTASAAVPATSATVATTSKPVGGEQPRAGGCQKDGDCPGGQVCEACKEGKCCTPGCRSDAACPKGQHCKAVQCFRAPCPSLCQ